MKTLTVRFTTSIDQRAILGACWDEGLDPATPDDELPDAVAAILVAICQDRIKEVRGNPKPFEKESKP